MAKEINLGGPKPSQQELLARVTGSGGKQPKLPPPPQQKGMKLPPGVTGTLPLPTGKIVGAVMPSGLSEAERSALEGIGWTEDVPIPANMAEILESERLRRVAESDEVVLPIDPRTPPVKMDIKKISEVSTEDRNRVIAAMRQASEKEQQQIKQAQQDATLKARAASVPGLQQALDLANAKRSSVSPDAIEDDRGIGEGYPDTSTGQQAAHDKARYVASKNPESAGEEAPKTTFEESPTGANAHPAFCPHCQWDLAIPDVPEPPYSEKMVFLHALLGQKCYTRDYELFGGNVTATFRTLTIGEIEAVYKQAWKDRETGKIITEVDYYERINRYRLFLQLQALKGTGPATFNHDLPDGLNKEVNPDATATWNLGDVALEPGETALPLIEEHVVSSILKTEAIFRVVNTSCNQFNRLVTKLEAMADNSDFWKPTEEQS